VDCRPGRKFTALALGIFLLFAACAAQAGEALTASASGAFDRPPGSDWALSWLEALFRGGALPQTMGMGASNLAALTQALRQALSLYSIAMLVLAGFLVLYHVIGMVAETAHYGTAMGRRANQLWAPIRFVLAIGLLTPISGGLNAGQHMIVALAESGSGLASNAWQGIVGRTKNQFSGYVVPRGPDVKRLAAVSVEMEICRSLYRQIYQTLQTDPAVRLVGDMPDMQKIPAERFVPETWRYSNNLHADLPLCGAFRFASADRTGGAEAQGINRFTNEIAPSARANAELLSRETRFIGDSISPAFLSSGSLAVPEIGGRLTSLIGSERQRLLIKLKAMVADQKNEANRMLEESAGAGWIAAGTFVPDVMRQQATYGEMAARFLPAVESPLFGHKTLTRPVIIDALAADPALHIFPTAQLEKVFVLYGQTAAAMKRARSWLYGQQLANADLVQADSLDLGDRVGPTTDAHTGFSLFMRLLDAGTAIFGVWAEEPFDAALGAPPSFIERAMTQNPLMALAEIGKRYQSLGTWLFGMTAPGLAESSVFPAAFLFAAIGLGLAGAGLVLLFVLPLLPFLRFFLAALIWFLEVFEAVVALPLVALAHLNPAGEGLSGATARQAYWLWLSLFMRPVLTLFGFIIGLALFLFAMAFLNSLFFRLAGPLIVAQNDIMTTVRIALAFLYVVLAYAAANTSFKGITRLPGGLLRWLNTLAVSESASPVPAATGAGQTSVAVLPPSPSGVSAGKTLSENVAFSGRASAAGADKQGTASAAERSRQMKAALIPAYREPPEEPVIIPKGGAAASAQTSGSSGGSQSAAAASVGGATASATAHATATVMAQNIPPTGRRDHPEILKAAASLAMLVEKQSALLDKTKAGSGKETKDTEGKTESPEQSSAAPEGEPQE